MRKMMEAIRTIYRLDSLLIWSSILSGLLAAIAPLVNVYLGRKIIAGLLLGLTGADLGRLVAITIAVNLLLLLLQRYFATQLTSRSRLIARKEDMSINHKIMQMDYEDVENEATHEKVRSLDLMRRAGGGSYSEVLYLQGSVQGLATMILGLILTRSFYTVAIPGWEMPLWMQNTIFFTAMISASIVSLVVANKIYNNLYAHVTNMSMGVNRLFDFYLGRYMLGHAGQKEIRVYTHPIIGRMNQENKDFFYTIYANFQRGQMKVNLLQMLATLINTSLIYAFIGCKAYAGLITIDELVMYIATLTMMVGGLQMFYKDVTNLARNNKYFEVLLDILQMENKKYQGSLPVEKRDDNQYRLQVRNVSFSYPGTDRNQLQGISLDFAVGEKVAVVGMNGSGKTTLIKLLARFYDPTEGEILLNGIDIKKFAYEEYLSLFSIVFQDFKLLSFELGQNVAAATEYDEEKVWSCLEKAGVSDRVFRMQDGLHTYLYTDYEPSGIEISGGEAQKIAMARALYKEAPFIILDEPTAALDPISEFEIYKKFDEIVDGRTAIYISHRLSSCRFCDTIIVFDEGRIVQQGNHDTLIQDTSGKYYELWHAQAQYYQEEEQVSAAQ